MNGRRLFQLVLIELFIFFQGMSFGMVSIFSEVFLHPHFQALTLNKYNILFFVFALSATIFAPIGGELIRKGKSYWVFIGSMILVLLSLVLTGLTDLFIGHHTVVFFMLCTALGCLGGGVGILMVILSQWMITLFPKVRFVALLFLFAAFSFGVTLSIVLVEWSLYLHKWWMSSVLIFIGLGVSLLIFELFESRVEINQEATKRLARWEMLLFLVPPFLYGYIESKTGLWNSIYLMQNRDEFFFVSSWAIVSLARVCVGFLLFFIPFAFFYIFLPVVAIVGAIYFSSFNGLLVVATSVLFPLNLAFMSRYFPATWLYGLNCSLYFLGIAGGFFFLYVPLIASIILLVVHLFTLYKAYAQEKGY